MIPKTTGAVSLAVGLTALICLLVGPLLRATPAWRHIGNAVALAGVFLIPLAATIALYSISKFTGSANVSAFRTLSIVAFAIQTFAGTAVNAMPESLGVSRFAVGVAATAVVIGGALLARGPRESRFLALLLLGQAVWVFATVLRVV